MAKEEIITKTETKDESKEYIIPLRKIFSKVPRYKRVAKAIKTIKKFLVRHMKLRDKDLKKIKIDMYLNEFMWRKGIRKPPTKIKIKAKKENGVVIAELAELPKDLSFKKQKLEKRVSEMVAVKKEVETEVEKAKEIKEEQKEEVKEPEKEKEAEEKKASVVESTQKFEKEIAKRIKHQTKISKQPKMQRRMALEK